MERKRLYKSKDDCMLFGVCGGVAEYFGVDSTIIRLLVAVFCLCLGTGLVAYLISALVIPSRPPEEPYVRMTGAPKKLRRSATDKTVCGVCGGVAEYFGIDSVIVRLLLVFFCLLGGSGVIAYIIAAIIILEADQA